MMSIHHDAALGCAAAPSFIDRRSISGEDEAWFEKFYVSGSQRKRDRITFSHH